MSAQDALLEKYFLTWDGEELSEQGFVVGKVDKPGTYLCKYFSWIAGEEVCQKIVHIDEMTTWGFYNNVDAMAFDVRKHGKRQKED